MANVEQIAEELDKLTLLEAAQLSKLLQEKWGVSAAAPMASRASRFFTTLYSADTALSCLRKSDSCWTVSPRYSASSTVLTPRRRVLSSSTVSTFSCVGIRSSLS